MDCRSDPVDNVRVAIAAGLTGLTFTEHFDTHPDDWAACVYDDEAYGETIDRLRRDFGDQIFIGKGIEVCYQPERMDFILDFLDRHTFDMVMLSVHYFGQDPVHARDPWDGLTVADGTRRYLETVLEAARMCADLRQKGGRVFDVLGHLDLVKRYTQRFFGAYDVSPHMDLIDEILATCIEADLTPEINTSSLRQGLSEPMPNAAVAQRYAQLGGKAMTIGSDAHRPEDIGAGLGDAVDILRQAGIDRLAVFTRRQRDLVPFD